MGDKIRVKIRMIPLSNLIDILVQLESAGVSHVNLIGELSEKKDHLKIQKYDSREETIVPAQHIGYDKDLTEVIINKLIDA